MFKSYFKIALRNLLRQKGYSLINITGLTVGLVVSLFILMYVRDELSYDGFHVYGDRLYRILEDQHYADGNVFTTSATPGPLAAVLKTEIPEIENAARLMWDQMRLFQYGDKSFKENGRYMDGEMFQMFSFPLVEGDRGNVLREPHSLVISESLARKYFGSESALGKLIRIDATVDYKVTGVMKDSPKNSSIPFDYAMPIEDFIKENEWMKEWGNNSARTYVLLREGVDAKTVESKIENVIIRKQKDSATTLFLQLFADVYLHSDFSNGRRGEGRIQYVWLFTLVAVFILIIACVNFMNLATAQSARRTKEVGVRKAIGAPRSSLIWQFLGESLLMSAIAAIAAVGIVELLTPAFNNITEKNISLDFANPLITGGVLCLIIVTGVVAGLYPAFFLSSLGTVSILKGTFRLESSSVSLRKGLVVFQFFISTILIVATIVVYQQIRFIWNKNMGIERDHVVYVRVEGDIQKNYEPIRQELTGSAVVSSMTMCDGDPMWIGNSTGSVHWPGKGENEEVLFQILRVNHNFAKTMRVTIMEGRDFSENYPSDVSGFVINEESAKRMRLESPVGQNIKVQGGEGPVIGLVKNFHTGSLHSGIEPLIIKFSSNPGYGRVFMKIEPGKIQESLAGIEKAFKRYNPEYPFEYHFWMRALSACIRVSKLSALLPAFSPRLQLLYPAWGFSVLRHSTPNSDQRKWASVKSWAPP